MEDVKREIRIRGALQQPEWSDLSQTSRVGESLATHPTLIQADDLATLRTLLGRVALGEAMVLQSGDCAEDPRECTRRPCRAEDRAARPARRVARPDHRQARPAGRTYRGAVRQAPFQAHRSDRRRRTPRFPGTHGQRPGARPRKRAGPIHCASSPATWPPVTSSSTWAGATAPQGARSWSRWCGPATRRCCSTTRYPCCAWTTRAGCSWARPTGRGSASAPARSTAPTLPCSPR